MDGQLVAADELDAASLRRGLGLVWGVTLGCALLVAALPGASGLVADWFAAQLTAEANPPPAVRDALGVALHNLQVLGFPFLLAAARLGQGRLRPVLDVLVAGAVVVQAGLVGAALGAYGARLLPFVPHLPFEWLALASSVAVWLVARRRPVTARELATFAAVFAAALLVACALELYATPHR